MAATEAAAGDERKPDSSPDSPPGEAARRRSAPKSPPKAPPSGPPDEAARARAYLDLWERHLVHAALHLRTPARARARGR